MSDTAIEMGAQMVLIEWQYWRLIRNRQQVTTRWMVESKIPGGIPLRSRYDSIKEFIDIAARITSRQDLQEKAGILK